MQLESVKSNCPHCGEVIELVIDTSVEHQTYIEDCQVCCCPIQIEAQSSADGLLPEVFLSPET